VAGRGTTSGSGACLRVRGSLDLLLPPNPTPGHAPGPHQPCATAPNLVTHSERDKGLLLWLPAGRSLLGRETGWGLIAQYRLRRHPPLLPAPPPSTSLHLRPQLPSFLRPNPCVGPGRPPGRPLLAGCVRDRSPA